MALIGRKRDCVVVVKTLNCRFDWPCRFVLLFNCQAGATRRVFEWEETKMANWYDNWSKRWEIARARFDAAQMEVDDALRSDAPYEETMSLIAHKANEWQHCKTILDELIER